MSVFLLAISRLVYTSKCCAVKLMTVLSGFLVWELNEISIAKRKNTRSWIILFFPLGSFITEIFKRWTGRNETQVFQA